MYIWSVIAEFEVIDVAFLFFSSAFADHIATKHARRWWWLILLRFSVKS